MRNEIRYIVVNVSQKNIPQSFQTQLSIGEIRMGKKKSFERMANKHTRGCNQKSLTSRWAILQRKNMSERTIANVNPRAELPEIDKYLGFGKECIVPHFHCEIHISYRCRLLDVWLMHGVYMLPWGALIIYWLRITHPENLIGFREMMTDNNWIRMEKTYERRNNSC